jgi:rod shape-determining protein MreB
MLNMFKSIRYVQLSPQRLTIRNPQTGVSISEVPEMAIAYEPKEMIVGVGAEARAHAADAAVKVINPFAHPRTLVSDFTAAEQLLKAFVRRMQGRSFLALAPTIVMHPLGEPEGGYTQIELRALREMAMGAGAAKVVMWVGPVLTDEEVLSGKFPDGGAVLA